jgi:hypothetical protein
MGTLRIWHGLIIIAAAGLILGLDGDPEHAAVYLGVIALSACLGVAGARYSGRSVWAGIWPVLLLGPFGLFVTWAYPRTKTPRRTDQLA